MLFKNKTILLVDDDALLLEVLTVYLGQQGLQVTACESGAKAKDLVVSGNYDVVLTDIRMNNSRIDGIELCTYIKNNKPMPVILMTGFASLTETETAARQGADAFLAKPFQKPEVIELLKKVLQVSETVEPENQDDNYCKVSIHDFISGRDIKFNIFIRVSSTRYIKIAQEGEDLDAERVQAYVDKGIKFLYLQKADFYKYMSFGLKLVKAAVSTSILNDTKKMFLLQHTTDVILEKIFTEQLDPESYEHAQAMVTATVDFLLAHETVDLMQALNQHADYLYAHSVAVSMYSVMLAKALGWKSPVLLYKLSVAGMMHDIGKKEIPRAILEKPRMSLSADEISLLESHAQRGMELLSQVKNIPSDVIQIVHHHHERDLGNGFPFGLTKPKIHPLARIIGFVDEFCRLIIKWPQNPEPMSPVEALLYLEKHHQKSFDATFFKGLRKVLQMEPLEPEEK